MGAKVWDPEKRRLELEEKIAEAVAQARAGGEVDVKAVAASVASASAPVPSVARVVPQTDLAVTSVIVTPAPIATTIDTNADMGATASVAATEAERERALSLQYGELLLSLHNPTSITSSTSDSSGCDVVNQDKSSGCFVIEAAPKTPSDKACPDVKEAGISATKGASAGGAGIGKRRAEQISVNGEGRLGAPRANNGDEGTSVALKRAKRAPEADSGTGAEEKVPFLDNRDMDGEANDWPETTKMTEVEANTGEILRESSWLRSASHQTGQTA